MSDPDSPWDCVVVGAGIIGLSTAYHLTKNGHRTLVLEQFPLPHSRGSSHGTSRIIRNLYDNVIYASMLPEAFKLWERFEEESGVKLMRQTGFLVVGETDSSNLSKSKSLMEKMGFPHHMLSRDDLTKRLPMMEFPPNCSGLLDPNGGALAADKCLSVLLNLIRRQGGQIKDSEQVTDVSSSASGNVTVTTSNGVYSAKKVVLALGPWAKELLSKAGFPDLPLKTMAGRSVFFKDKTGGQFRADNNFPIVIHQQYKPTEYRFYAYFPTVEYPGLVKAITRGEPPPRYSHPDERDRYDKNELAGLISDHITKHVPGLDPRPDIIEPCVYTMTPDRDYIVDFHPRNRNIVAAAGFSGHGFKLAPVIGKLLWEMVAEKPTSYDITPFRANRFNSKL